jgi:hypothetical protein
MTGAAALLYRLLDDGNGLDCDDLTELFENERLPSSWIPKKDKITFMQIAWTMASIKGLQAYHSLFGTPSLLEGVVVFFKEEL